MRALALTDHGNMFGAVKLLRRLQGRRHQAHRRGPSSTWRGARASSAAGTENGNKYWHLILLAKNAEGYRNLLKLSSASYTEGFYYKPRIDFEPPRRARQGAHRELGLHRGRDPEPRAHGQGGRGRTRGDALRGALRARTASTSSSRTTASPSRRPRTGAWSRSRGARGFPSSARTTCTTSSAPTPRPTTSSCASAPTASATSRGACASTGSEFYMKTPRGDGRALRRAARGPRQHAADRRDGAISRSPTPARMLPDYEIPEPSTRAPRSTCGTSPTRGSGAATLSITDEIRRAPSTSSDVIIKMKFTGYFLIVWDFIDWAKEQRHPRGAGPRLRRGLHRGLRPAHHRHRPPEVQPPLRALPQPRAHLDAGLRHRLLLRAPRRGHRLRDAQVRVGPHRADHHLRDPQGQGRHQGRGARPRHPLRGREQHRQARARGSAR